MLATQLPLLVNTTTLLPVFMPFAPAAPVLTRFPDALATVLRAHSIAEHIVDREHAATADYGSPRPMTAASSA